MFTENEVIYRFPREVLKPASLEILEPQLNMVLMNIWEGD